MSLILSPEVYPVVHHRLPIHTTVVSRITPYGTYTDINSKKRITKYFYYKVLDKWIYADYSDLLGLLVIKNNKVELADDPLAYKKKKPLDTLGERELKVRYLAKYIITKKFVYNVLERFVRKSIYEWHDLQPMERNVKEYMRYKLKQKLMYKIENK